MHALTILNVDTFIEIYIYYMYMYMIVQFILGICTQSTVCYHIMQGRIDLGAISCLLVKYICAYIQNICVNSIF